MDREAILGVLMDNMRALLASGVPEVVREEDSMTGTYGADSLEAVEVTSRTVTTLKKQGVKTPKASEFSSAQTIGDLVDIFERAANA